MRETTEDNNKNNEAGNASQPSLLQRDLVVVNVGLERFHDDLAAQGTPVTQVAWAPPAGGNAELAALLAKLGG